MLKITMILAVIIFIFGSFAMPLVGAQSSQGTIGLICQGSSGERGYSACSGGGGTTLITMCIPSNIANYQLVDNNAGPVITYMNQQALIWFDQSNYLGTKPTSIGSYNVYTHTGGNFNYELTVGSWIYGIFSAASPCTPTTTTTSSTTTTTTSTTSSIATSTPTTSSTTIASTSSTSTIPTTPVPLSITLNAQNYPQSGCGCNGVPEYDLLVLTNTTSGGSPPYKYSYTQSNASSGSFQGNGFIFNYPAQTIIKLTVTDSIGDSASSSILIKTPSVIISYFSPQNSIISPGQSIIFTNSTEYGSKPYTYVYSITPSTGVVEYGNRFIFNDPGSYRVQLSVTGEGGITYSTYTNVNVNGGSSTVATTSTTTTSPSTSVTYVTTSQTTSILASTIPTTTIFTPSGGGGGGGGGGAFTGGLPPQPQNTNPISAKPTSTIQFTLAQGPSTSTLKTTLSTTILPTTSISSNALQTPAAKITPPGSNVRNAMFLLIALLIAAIILILYIYSRDEEDEDVYVAPSQEPSEPIAQNQQISPKAQDDAPADMYE